jgi:pyrroline-5-carboxylate reductase
LGFIGVGNMGAAIVRGVLDFRLLGSRSIWVADTDPAKTKSLAEDLEVHEAASNIELLLHADTVVLAVKPQGMDAVLRELAPVVRPEHLFVSIAAGVPTRAIESRLGPGVRVVRVMPNTPALLAHGAAALAPGAHATAADLAHVRAIFEAVGVVVEVEERLINAVTGLSGSGPAYVFYLMEALARAGEKVGLSADVAATLSRQTVLGAAYMACQAGKTPEELRRQVTSPNGTTEAGLKVMTDGDFVGVIERTVARATERGEELGRAFD